MKREIPPPPTPTTATANERIVRVSRSSRRRFLELMGAGAALAAAAAGAGGCSRVPAESIVGYVDEPEKELRERSPGRGVRYASCALRDGFGCGILVETHAGHPTKIEGLPGHPMSLGAASAREQASILALYDPARPRAPRHRGQATSTTALDAGLTALRRRMVARKGEGSFFVLPPSTSPSLAIVLAKLLEELPQARVIFASAREEHRFALGAVELLHDLRRAQTVLSLDEDLFAAPPDALRLTHDFFARRRSGDPQRLLVVDDGASLAAAKADASLRIAPSRVAWVALALASALRTGASPTTTPTGASLSPDERRFVANAAHALARGPAAILVGDRQTPPVHLAAAEMRALLGERSTTTAVASPLLAGATIEALADALASGAVEALVTVDVDLAYLAPRLDLSRARERVHGAVRDDATTAGASWFVPLAHDLERWGDARAVDGTLSIQQPTVRPLYAQPSARELFAAFLPPAARTADRAQVVDAIRASTGGDVDEVLRRGYVPNASAAPTTATTTTTTIMAPTTTPPSGAHVELSIRGDLRWHNAFELAQVPWLLEMPDPLTHLTWENALLLSPATAARVGVVDGDVVAVGGAVEAPIVVHDGVGDGVGVVHRGWGRPSGFSVQDLSNGVVALAKTGRRRRLARTVEPEAEGRAYTHLPASAAEAHKSVRAPLRLYGSTYATSPQWGMSVDVDACTGCGACVIACQAENNVPVVGRDGVLMRREMHWLRVDVIDGAFVPMMCQHCEAAPCEVVCPVAATLHSADGLNEMIYNRCVGTRFCSNNCPYKVRRFNWLDYRRGQADVAALATNPDVTVRSRGVMEKCTYCVQRIRAAEIDAGIAQRPVADGDVVTACAQTCPSHAIVFGRVDDEGAEVARLHADPRAFALLAEEGTRPRTRYLMPRSRDVGVDGDER